MTVTTKRSLIALLLSLVLVVSLFTVGISATEVTTAAADEVTTTVDGTDANTETSAESESSTEAETEAVADTSAADAAKKTLIINGIIIVAILVVLVVVYFKFRAKLNEFFRSVKSELKKITWSSMEQTRKGFLVAIVVTVIFAVGLLLIDLAFGEGISYLDKLFR
jgi:preprotein translocase SecE subunit